jgi:hypothetical protein
MRGPHFLVIFIFLFSSVHIFLEGPGPVDMVVGKTEEENVIIWDSNTEGEIYNWYPINGTYQKDVTGYADGKGNFFIGSYRVLLNETLIIHEGVNIIFEKYYTNQFVIYGSLIIEGTEGNKVVFKGNDSGEIEWNGLRIYDGPGEVTIENCIFINGFYSDVYREITLKDCEFNNCSMYYGNSKRNIDKAVITGCSFIGNTDGYYSLNKINDLIFTNCILSDTMDFLRISRCGSLKFEDNIVNFTGSLMFESSDKMIFKNNLINIKGTTYIGNSDVEDSKFIGNQVTTQRIAFDADGLVIKDQKINGIVDMASNITLEGNTISKGIYFNSRNGGIRDNIFENISVVT